LKYILSISFTLITLFSFSQELNFEDGLYYEKPIRNDSSRHRYSIDNISYKPGMVFIYDYYYLDHDGSKKKFLRTNDESSKINPLNLEDPGSKSDSLIDKIRIEVNDYIDMFSKMDTDYTQTVFAYIYLNKQGKAIDTLCEFFNKRNKLRKDFPCGDEMTGIIDNAKNLWMHPPRSFTFKILEFNPFPFQYLDESVKEWRWSLDVGGPHYMDQRWIKYNDGIHINYLYSRAKEETLSTPLGKIRCKVTNATATSEFGNNIMKTRLKSYYHPKYGFVKLEYTSINGSQLIMDLIEMNE
jgi:hypothetical protein